MKSAEEIREIVKVCKENKIEITGSVFAKNSKQLRENIEYVSFINKKMDAISARIKESGDQSLMKKLSDVYAMYPTIQK